MFDPALVSTLTPILWIITGCAIIAFSLVSAVFLWHWKQYSTGRYTTVVTMAVYLGVGGGLLGLMSLAALWYSVAA